MTLPPGLGILTTDAELRVRSWNDWLAGVTGLSEADVHDRLITELVPTDRRDLVRDLLAEVLTTGRSRVLAPAFHRYFIQCKPSQPSRHFTEMQQDTIVAALRSEDAIVGAMVTIEDVTARLGEERDLAARLTAETTSLSQPAIVAAVGADDWRIRAAAIRALERPATREDRAHLVNRLLRDHQDLSVVSGALQVLASMHHDVAEPLIALLSDPSPDLRMHAALALGMLGNLAAVPGLLQAMDDDDVNVRFHAIEALGRLRAGEAVAPLARVAAGGNFFLAFPALDALANIDDAGVIPSLVGLLDQELLRPAVIDALAALGDEESVAPLVSMLNEGTTEAAPVAEALARIASRYENAFTAGAHIVNLTRTLLAPAGIRRLTAAALSRKAPLEPLVTVLGWVGAPGLDGLIAVVGEPALESALTTAFAAVGGEAVEPLVERLVHGDHRARLSAAGFLGHLADPRAASPLAHALSSADATLVRAAAAALARIGDPHVLDALLPLFANEHAAVRHAVVAAVNAIGAAATHARIRARLTDPDPRVRECAIRVAGYLRFDDAVDGVLAGLRDANDDVRRAAIEQLATLDDSRALPSLLRALREETARNRGAAAHVMRSVADATLEPALRGALDDPDAWVRYFAAGSLGLRGGTESGAALARVARTDAAAHVRIAAVQALGRLKAVGVTAVASELVRGPDDEVACAALTALGGAAGPDAGHVLEQAVRSSRTELQMAAVQALAARGTVDAVEALAWAAGVVDSPRLTLCAVDGLRTIAGSADAPSRTAAIAGLLALGADPARRDAIAAALGSLHDGAVDLLAGELASSARVPVRLLVVDALARMRRPKASEALIRALRDEEAAVRSAAIVACGRLGPPAAAPIVAAMRASDRDPAVRRRAAVVCDWHGWQPDGRVEPS